MIKFICQKCGKQTQDTVGGVLHDGFLLECSECFEITVVRFGDYSVEHRLHLTGGDSADTANSGFRLEILHIS